MSGASRYRKEVAKTPAAARAAAQASEAAAQFGTPLRFVNLRRPFAMLDRLTEGERAWLRQLARSNGVRGKSLEKLAHDEEWAPMELVDVVDETGTVKYQLCAWSYGCGSVRDVATGKQIGAIIQHGYDPRPGDLPLRRALAAAYASAPLSETIDFQLDYEPPPPATQAKPETIIDRIHGELRAAIDGDAGALAKLKATLKRDEILAIPTALADDNDSHAIICERAKPVARGGLYEWHFSRSDAELVEHAIRAYRVLGDLVASVDGARELELREDRFYIGIIACYAQLARGGAFPDKMMAMALAAHYAPGPIAEEPIRPVLAAMTLAQRERYVKERRLDFETTDRIEIAGGKRKKVPYAGGLWIFADLIATPAIAKPAIDAIAAWPARAQPVERVLEVIHAIGAPCVPLLDKAIARTKGRNRDVLKRARASLTSVV